MVIESNTLDFIFLKDGEQGAPGDPGENGKTLYTWIKYSQNSDGSDMTDDPDNAIYIGLAYNKESATESTNPSDYSWSKFKGSDAYTIVLTNENISFATDKNGTPLSNQSQTCEVIVLKGTDVITNFTIGTLTSITGISTSVSNRVITLSTNTSTAITSDSGEITVPITIDGVKFSKVITYSISKQGESGIDAKSLDLYSSSYTVAFDSNGKLKDTSNIILTVNQQNYSDSITWSTNPSVTLGTVSGNSYQRTLPPSVFNNNDKIQITVSSGDLSDFVTIVKVQDGDNGEDAYTIILSNESHTFVGNENAALESSTKCDVVAFKGTVQMPVTIGTISGLPTGMTASISNNGTINSYFSPTVTTSMTSKSGTLTIPITVDGVSFTKYFSYALALKGDAGTNGISVSSVEVYYYLSTSSTELIGGSWSTERPTWVDGKYIWSKQKTTLSNGSSSETDPVCITGGTGATGDTGRGVESITTEYYLSTSKTEQIGGEWSENQPEWSSGHYVWTRSKIVYSNPTSVEYTSPVCDTTWEAMQAQIDTVTKTISDVELKVDKNTKSITEKVWQSDITNSINNYDGSTAQAIRDRVSKTETDISGITSTVSDIQTSVSKKADGSTVTELQKTVTENKQDADSFKQTVKETYATKDSLNDYATTSQVSSAIEQKANIILGTVTDSEGNTTTYQGTLAGLASQVKDNENRMTQIEQTSEEISLKAGTAQKLAIESKTLSVNLSVETMTVATDTDGNNGSYSNCKTSIRVMYGIEDVTSDVSITCAPSDGIEYLINLQDKTCSITNMTHDNGYVDISASYIVTIDGVEKTLIDTSRFSVSKSKQGNVGAAGESVSVVSNVVLYQRSPNGTEIPTGEWSEEIQERNTGIYVSNHIDSNGVLIYSDGATLNSDGVLVINDTSKQSNTYITTDGVLVSQDITQDLKYLWTKTITTYSDGNECISYTVSSDGDTGNGISSSEVTYQVSSDGTTPPTGEWTSEIPVVGEGEYLWTKTVTSYTNGTTSTSYSVGSRGEQGVSVVSVTPEYYLSTSETEVVGGSWTETPPVKTNTTYIWKREHTVFDNNTEAYSSAVLDASLNKLFEVTAELTVSQEEITAEIKDAKGSSTTLKARLEGIDASVIDAESNAKSFATQEAERIQNVVQNNIDNVESNITQRADDIELNVAKKKDNPLTAIRYIRDWLNGSNENTGNHWVNCKVVSNDTDIANGIIATLYNSNGSLSSSQPSNIDIYTNGDTSSSPYVSGGSGWMYLQLDLGSIRSDIDYIHIWHYYADNRIYNHRLEISSDGTNWISLYNSAVQGGYSESSTGKIYNISDTVSFEQYTSLSVKMGKIESTVYDGMEKINQSISTSEGNIKSISEQLGNVEVNVNAAISSLPDKKYVQTKIEEKAGQISSEIKTVQSGLETKISKVTQDSDKWLVNFAKLGMENSPGINTIIKLSEEGMRVSQSDGSEVLVDGNGLQGFYNSLAVFQLKKNLTITDRIQVSNGADFTTVKYINREYQTSNGTAKCLVHVTSGGSS